MPSLETYERLFVGSVNAVFLNASPSSQVKIANGGPESVYYKNEDDVDTGDTEIADGGSATLEEPVWVISKANGAHISVSHLEAPTHQDLTVSDDLTVTDDFTVKGKATVEETLDVTGASTLTGKLTAEGEAKIEEALVAKSTLAVTGATTVTGGVKSTGTLPGVYAGGWSPIAATSGTDTAPAEKKLFITGLWLPANKTIKGIGFLVGSVGGTDKCVLGLFDNAGTFLAGSTEAEEGTVVGTKEEIQEIDLTEEYEAVGPALYYVAFTANGGTARFRTIPANTAGANVFAAEKELAAKNTMATFAEPPTTFTGGKGPVAWVY